VGIEATVLSEPIRYDGLHVAKPAALKHIEGSDAGLGNCRFYQNSKYLWRPTVYSQKFTLPATRVYNYRVKAEFSKRTTFPVKLFLFVLFTTNGWQHWKSVTLVQIIPISFSPTTHMTLILFYYLTLLIIPNILLAAFAAATRWLLFFNVCSQW